MNELQFKTLTLEEIQQNELDFLNYMSEGEFGDQLMDEYNYFGEGFYDE